jgi:chromodomain-helicase-DNA-binding protein 1
MNTDRSVHYSICYIFMSTNHSQEGESTDRPVEQDSGRKRKAVFDSDREGRKAKRLAAKELSSGLGDDSEEESDPKQPLNPREIRNLYRAYTRYGLLDDCWNAILKDAGLEGRDSGVIKSTIDDLIRLSKEAVRSQRSAQGETGKKEKKAILFDYKGAKKLNAETLLNRPEELRCLREKVVGLEDRTKFRIHDVKPITNWSCEWGTREDSMLCVGIVKHGYGAWAAIRDDPELSMHNKFFLEEHRVDKKEERGKAEAQAKSPGAVHLVRRADYLLGVLKERNSGPRSPPEVRPKIKRKVPTSTSSPAPNSKHLSKVKASEDHRRPRQTEKREKDHRSRGKETEKREKDDRSRGKETEKREKDDRSRGKETEKREKDDRSRGKETKKRRREPEEAERKVRRRPSPEAESRKRRREPDEADHEVRHRPSPHSETRRLEVRRSNGVTAKEPTPRKARDLDLSPAEKRALVCALNV